MEIIILNDDDPQALHCMAIRRTVFVQEQHVPEERDRDGLDAISRHYLFMHDGVPVGTARSRLDAMKIKIERFALLPRARGLKLGAQAFRAVMEDCVNHYPALPIVIGAQAYLQGFYERLGFKIKGNLFKDAGIDHIEMTYTNHLT